MLLLVALACRPDWVDDPVAFIEDAQYRRDVLESGLVSRDNRYAERRLEHVGGDWDDLPLWDPPSGPVTVELREQLSQGGSLEWTGEATTLTPDALPTTDAGWIALGERVFFEYPIRNDPTVLGLLESEEGPGDVGFLLEDGAYVGMRVFEDEGRLRVAPTCAQCHVSRGPDGTLTGQLANRMMDAGRARLIGRGEGDPDSETNSSETAELLELGPGRSDVLPDAVFNPYAFPDFGGLVDQPYLHHNANWFHEGNATLALRCETLFITSNFERARIPRVLVWAVARWIRSLPPLDPPEPEHPLREEGRVVFEASGCADCHVPPLYTSARQVLVSEVGTDPSAGESPVRATGLYRIPSLRGVGHLAPYLHHGAFDTLEAMFEPGRSEPGHPWGLELDAAEREALLGFLRSI